MAPAVHVATPEAKMPTTTNALTIIRLRRTTPCILRRGRGSVNVMLRTSLQLGLQACLPDRVELPLQRQLIERLEPQTREDLDTCVELPKRRSESLGFLLVGPFYFRRIVDTPMGRHGLSRPERTRFLGRVVTHRKHEIEGRGGGHGKFVPTLATKIVDWQLIATQDLDRERMYLAFRVTSRAIRLKPSLPPLIQEGLAHDAPSR